jgi:putative ABC transport system ATP-binding protein
MQQVSKIFVTGGARVKALANISLEIQEGAFWVVAGPSGSGKTTLLNLIGGLDEVTSGEIQVGGMNLSGMTERDLALYRRHHVGFIFQGNNLIPTLTAFENIEIPLILTGEPERKAKVHDILAEIGLQGKAHRFPQFLSAGEQQRVAVARALVHAPRLVLADEPTANLDLKTGTDILSLLQRLNRKLKRTVLFSTHDQRIIGTAENVLRLRDGRLEPH